MRYSLISRFRGTLFGALIAGTLPIKDVNSPINSPLLTQEVIDDLEFSGKNLISQGKLNLGDWLLKKKANSDLNRASLGQINLNQANEQLLLATFFATLPIALFFHENPLKLKQNITDVARLYSDDFGIRDSNLAIGYAIAKSLTETLNSTALIPQIVDFLGDTSSNVPQHLLKVHHLLGEGTSFQQVKAELSKLGLDRQNTFSQNSSSKLIAEAFYCFLATLEDFHLSILLSHKQADPSFRAISPITGALSGAYNSTVGIPIGWQTRYLQQKSAKLHSNTSLQMVKLADELLAVWSGVYNIDNQASKTNKTGDSTFHSHRLSLLEPDFCLRVSASPRVNKQR
ncbi:MAG: ADP-ribosylglycohydrolase family protein [Methylacidiphilales bacterium]|nr:ADP-ribosylglycohydrolase family protein [Candidatus Methylacidiphilales bacterium]NJR17596.1 ADP-ribosylglycohydrolase family protein [Calothrix sp. CSU_2_0]